MPPRRYGAASISAVEMVRWSTKRVVTVAVDAGHCWVLHSGGAFVHHAVIDDHNRGAPADRMVEIDWHTTGNRSAAITPAWPNCPGAATPTS
ncbi:hypothetical protein GCM10027089_41460 [Nocardia thraciensis]